MKIRDSVETLGVLREIWSREEVQLWPPATAEQLRSFERKHGVAVPSGLMTFFLTVGGMKNPDSHHLRVWPIFELAQVSATERSEMGLPSPSFWFADHLVWSNVFAIHLGASTPVFITGSGTARVADSFDAFLHAYLADPDSVLAP